MAGSTTIWGKAAFSFTLLASLLGSPAYCFAVPFRLFSSKLLIMSQKSTSPAALDRLCVIGHPSRLGGADTELDHQIRCWQHMGIKVHVCHTGTLDDNLLSMKLEDRGCVYHSARDWKSLEGYHVISFCNGDFLRSLNDIRKYARTISWVNCMTWNFDDEIKMHAQGNIDFHLYQTAHAYRRVSPALRDLNVFRPLFFTPYFHCEEFPFISDRPQDRFCFGRISRPDPAKFASNQLWIYETMTAPVLKEGLVLGWSPQVEEKLGKPSDFIRTAPAGSVSQQDFYRHCEAVIFSSDTFENLPRAGLEAMASGSIVVADHRGGWPQLLEDGRTGWLCHDGREFVYKASRCAFEANERAEMRQRARQQVEIDWGLEASARSWEQVFAAWMKLR